MSPWTLAAGGIAAIVGVPLLAVIAAWRDPAVDVWVHLWRTQLPELIANTLFLVAGVGAGTLTLGAALAWLIVGYRFPGRALFEWALGLPLAVPAYVIGFVFLGLFDFAGPVQSALRRWFGDVARLPELPSGLGVVLVMTLVFYPYVYLMARAAFREHGLATLETARSLGRSRLRAFVGVMVPMARPSLVAGASLAMMEALADLGTVSTFGYRTLTEAVYRVWTGMFDRIAATQLASLLLFVALGLLLLERALRGHRRFTQSQRRGPGVVPVPLRGWAAAAATGACGLVLGVAFVLPIAQLLVWAVDVVRRWRVSPDFVAWLGATFLLAGTAAVLICVLGLTVAYAGRLHPSPSARVAAQVSSMGYALPGAVIAMGVLAPIAWLDWILGAAAEWALGWRVGLLLTGSACAVLFAYAVRFLTVGFQALEASLAKIPSSFDEVARSLGVAGTGTLRRIHLPLMRGSLLTALALVWVEVMKELPATLLLRPLGLKTLAIEVWERTSESMWADAAIPSLAIVAVGLLPLFLVSRFASDPGGR
ncbi:MAG TPA: iron ABC transporter permease [Methylomirabilota bacterium]|nr:iron ABC transporter permease [Methylomirabilota bacterium]